MRLVDWPERLPKYLADQSRLPFVWGQTDCACFALGAYKALTGKDLALPHWADENGANEVLAGFGGIAAACDRFLLRIDPKHAGRGDVVMFDVSGRQWLGVCDGLVSFCRVERMAHLPTSQAVAAWRVK